MKLLKFWAPWCAPCKQQAKILEDFKDLPIEEVNIDEEENLAKVDRYGIRSIPTLIITDNTGTEIKRFNGVTPITEIKKFCDGPNQETDN